MKKKAHFLFSAILVLNLLTLMSAKAQNPEYRGSSTPAAASALTVPENANSLRADYSYRLFIAPNKVFGYDIFLNGRIIFHQPALPEPAGDKRISLTKKPQADKAAMLAIEKIKKGIAPGLTRQDVVLITAH